MKKGALKNIGKFTAKHLCQSPFFDKVAGRPAEHFFYKTPLVAASIFTHP